MKYGGLAKLQQTNVLAGLAERAQDIATACIHLQFSITFSQSLHRQK
jgi:hypothetical protein